MKHGKRPTVRQKKIIKAKNLNPENWLVVKDTAEGMMIIHRISEKTKVIARDFI